MIAALMITLELLSFSPQSHRADIVLRALAKTAPKSVRAVATQQYVGGSDWLMFWGPGHPARFEPMRRQIAAGGRCIVFDLADWDRNRKVRVSIDAAHPQAWVMRQDWPSDRLRADKITMGDAWNPAGPVMVAGLGDKARVQYGSDRIDEWETAMMATCRADGREVQYRGKKVSTVPIERALQGVGLVVTWHSNVAVDAIRLGIPVVCQDGAAAAVCPSVLPPADRVRPLSAALRDRFLSNLAWFQWLPDEPGIWPFLQELLA